MFELAEGIQVFLGGSARAAPIAVLRVLIGLIVLVDAILLFPDRRAWLGEHGVLSASATTGLSFFRFARPTDTAVTIFLVVHMGLALAFTVGFGGTVVAATLFLSLVSIANRNRYILYGGDNVLHTMVFLLAVVPSTAAISADHWLLHSDLGWNTVAPRWSLQLLQLQVVIIYVYSALHKDKSPGWRDGTALAGALNNRAFENYPLPAFVRSMRFSTVATPLVVLFEYSFVLLFFDELRFAVAIAAIGFQAVLGYCLSIHLFTPIMIACLTLFLWPDEAYGNVVSQDPVPWPILVFGVSYLAHAVLWDCPVRTLFRTVYRHLFSKLVRAVGLAHRWSMFAGGGIRGSGSTQLEIVVEFSTGEVSRFGWDQRQGLHADSRREPSVTRHRRRKFIESLAHQTHVVAPSFAAYLRRELTARSPAETGVSALALVIVREPIRRSQEIRTLLFRRTWYDEHAGCNVGHARFAIATEEDRSDHKTLELLLGAGVMLALEGEDDTEVRARVRALLERVSPRHGYRGLAVLIDQLPPSSRQVYKELLACARG